MTNLEKIAAEAKASHWTNISHSIEQAIILAVLSVIVIAIGIISILEFDTITALIIVSGEITLLVGYLYIQYLLKKKKERNDNLILTCAVLAGREDCQPEYIAYFFEKNHVAFSQPRNEAFNELLMAYLSEAVENSVMHNSDKLKKWKDAFPHLMKQLDRNKNNQAPIYK